MKIDDQASKVQYPDLDWMERIEDIQDEQVVPDCQASVIIRKYANDRRRSSQVPYWKQAVCEWIDR
jgi:hypothetical protein